MGANQFIPVPLPDTRFKPFIDANLVPVSGITSANPAVVTTGVPHGLLTGDVIVIRGVVGVQGAPSGPVEGIFQITVTGLSTFELDGFNALGASPYVSGGQVARSGKRFVGLVTPGTPIMIETYNKPPLLGGAPIEHRLLTGDMVEIKNDTIFPAINGKWTVTVTSLTEFTLDGSTDIGAPALGNGTIDLAPFPVVCQTPTPHGYSTGDIVDVRASSSDPGRLFEITFISATQFSLNFEGEDVQYPSGGIVRAVTGAIVDLAAVVPPNGVEKRKTFSVAGDYSGRLILEGSMDGALFSPFLLFNEGKPGGIKVVEVNVPFIRARADGLVINSGNLVGFMAAEQNCDCLPAWSDHGANVYDNFDVPDPAEIPFDREAPVSIASTSFATPIVVATTVPHPYFTGDEVRVSGVLDGFGIPLASVNGVWTITYISPLTFSLDTSIGTDVGTGGVVEIITAPNTSPIPLRTAVPHGYVTGDTVRVRGVVDEEFIRAITTAFSPDNLTLVTVTTAVPHGYTTGNRVDITGNTDLPDGTYTITVTGLTTFTLNGVFGPINGSGGSSLRIPGANGDFVITVTGPDTFTLNGSIATGPGTRGTVQALLSAGTDTSTMKSEKTLQLQGGPYTGAFVIDATLDPGLTPIFLPFDQFNTGGADEKLELDALFFAMRIRPVGASGDVSIFIGSQLTCECEFIPPPPGARPGMNNKAAAKLAKRKAPKPASPKKQKAIAGKAGGKSGKKST